MTAPRIGVYVCHCGSNIAGTVNVPEVVAFAATLPNVVAAREYKFMCSDPGQELIQKDIRELQLTRVVVASCSPLMHENTFRKAVRKTGLNQYLFQMANIREQCSWVGIDQQASTEKAKALVAGAVGKAEKLESLQTKEVPIHPDTLVVGGGIAGIQAALEIAQAEKKVYLVERLPSIGGKMAKFDKTFPTLDCAACILTPKMVSVAQNPNVQLMTLADVKGVAGYIGNFNVKIRRKARYVEQGKCTACGECEKVCPVEVPNEFDEGLSKRHAIYRLFPQAVPNTYAIDKRGKPPCKLACPIEQDAAGYTALIGMGKYEEAIKLIRKRNPLPSVCGRVCYHPCEDACRRGELDEPIAIRQLKRFASVYEIKHRKFFTSESKPATGKKVAVIGSGPAGLAAAHDLALLGHGVTIFEALPVAGGMLAVGIPEYRLPEDILRHDLDAIKGLGVKFQLNTPLDSNLTLDDLAAQGFEAVFVASGAHKGKMMGIPGETLKGVFTGVEFLRMVNLGIKMPIGNKIIVVGGGNTAIDCARTAVRLGAKDVMIAYRRSEEEMPASDEEIAAAKKEGVSIMVLANPVEIVGEGDILKRVRLQRMQLGEPDADGRRKPIPIPNSEFLVDADTVIMATMQETAVPPVLGRLKTTRWGTFEIDPESFQTNVKGIFAGGDAVSGPASVVEAMAQGKKAAFAIDKHLRGLFGEFFPSNGKSNGHSVEERDWKKVYGHIPYAARVEAPELPVEERIGNFQEVEQTFTEEEARHEAKRCLMCSCCVECGECVRVCEAKAINHDMTDTESEIEVGNIILATGFQLFDSAKITQYGYNKYDNVLSPLEFERLNSSSGPTGGKILMKNGQEPQRVGLIHCIGSRDSRFHPYCSKVCCMYALKFAHLIREKTRAEVYDFYIDLRCSGKGYEEFYNRILEEETRFIRGRAAEVSDFAIYKGEEGKLVIRAEDTLAGFVRRIPVDMVVLCAAMEPMADAAAVARMYSIQRSKDGFFLEKHPKLAPVATNTDGIFIVGCCQAPKDIPDSVAQASAAAAGVLSLISRGKIEVEAITSTIDSAICAGCRICNTACPYSAITFNVGEKRSEINEALCKGCGTCAAACPNGAITSRHFTNGQIMSEIEGILKSVE